MKRIMALILAAVMIFSMTACGGEKTYTKDDLAIRDIDSGKLIRIGDSREDIEKIVGEPEGVEEEADGELVYNYSDNMEVTYNESGEVICVHCFNYRKEENKYELAEGVGFGQTQEDFFNAYPGAENRWGGMMDSFVVRKREDSKKYKLYTEVLDDPEATDSIAIYVFYDTNLKIGSFEIVTYKYE